MKQEEMFIIAAQSVIFSLTRQHFCCRERVFFFVFCLNIPCLFTMHISILLCMLIMVHRKMLIEKIGCINKSTDLLLRLRKDYCCSQKEKNGNLGKVLKLKVRLNKVSDLDYIQILAFKVVKIILFQTVSYNLCQLIPEATW